MPVFKRNHCIHGVCLLFFTFVTAVAACGCGRAQKDSFMFQEESLQEAESLEAVSIPQTDTALDTSVPMEQTDGEESGLTAGCVVHICGAVRNPGVYELPKGSRIMDAVTAGGGFLPEADTDACNLAALLSDGCQVYIMTQEESSLAALGPPEAGMQADDAEESVREDGGQPSGDGKVNLNTADADRLKTLPGIGDSRAAAIITWREENGTFGSIEDIMKVSGIKQAAFDKIKDKIKV